MASGDSGDSGDSPSKVATAAMGRGWDVRVVGQQFIVQVKWRWLRCLFTCFIAVKFCKVSNIKCWYVVVHPHSEENVRLQWGF